MILNLLRYFVIICSNVFRKMQEMFENVLIKIIGKRHRIIRMLQCLCGQPMRAIVNTSIRRMFSRIFLNAHSPVVLWLRASMLRVRLLGSLQQFGQMLLPDGRPGMCAMAASLIGDGQQNIFTLLHFLNVRVDDLQFRRIDDVIG